MPVGPVRWSVYKILAERVHRWAWNKISGRWVSSPARETVNEMIEAGLLDRLMARVDGGGSPG